MNNERKIEVKPVDTDFRFRFGKNWRNYIKLLSEERLRLAMDSLKVLLDTESLNGKLFIDVGCGSGIFSLAAIRLGAKQVVSIDYDKDSVNCAQFLKERYGPFDNWTIQQGSILDSGFVDTLGTYDVVYSWGVLHHTGNMWKALENVSMLVKADGILAVSIYNDQGLLSKFWAFVKYIYNKSPAPVQWLMGNLFFVVWALLMLLLDMVNRRPVLARYHGVNARGMNAYYDSIDWVGGYPFEVATPTEIFKFYKAKDYQLVKLETRSGMGCNEYVFIKHNNEKI